MPYFELTTNVKEVPAEFHKEATNLIAELLGKPSPVSVTFPSWDQVCAASSRSSVLFTFAAVKVIP